LDITFDCESNNLLNAETIDYTASPYKLKDSFTMHCVVVEEHETGNIIAFYDGDTFILDGRTHNAVFEGREYKLENYTPVIYKHLPLSAFKGYVERGAIKRVIAHNGINFDLLATKLYFGMGYSVQPDTWCGKNVDIIDTLVMSKTLNPDRFGGHSLDKLSEKTGTKKVNFRPHIPQAEKFKFFFADMLYYCIYDCKANTAVYKMLLEEWGTWNWTDAFNLEKAVADVVTRQEHRGFKFNMDLARTNLAELDQMMEDRRSRVEPILPKKKATQSFMKDFTPPKQQLKKDMTLSANMEKFLKKHGGTFEDDGFLQYATIFGVKHVLPMPTEPLVTTEVASIEDTTHIKEWLVRDFGWEPSEFKERDLSVNSKKEKLSKEKLKEAIDRYVEQTLNSSFCEHRCEFLQVTPAKLKAKLMSYKEGRAIKVLTNPSFTRGQEKEICPNLAALGDRFPYAKDIVEYLTYRHRRNSILGGGLEWDDEEEVDKGYLAYVREDGRIPTPADTCGAATSRFKHRVVANIPRVTSLYGGNMRGMFGVDDDFIQFGYDFDSLEARIESHYAWRYDPTKEYCNSLLQDKPNDVHTMMASKISAIISRVFARSPAKSVKYAATYGATAPKIAKTIGESLAVGEIVFNAFWEAASPLKMLKDNLLRYWETVGGKKFVLGIDGRKVPTRSAHAILNSLFQSAGVISAKRAMVIHDRLLRAEGLAVDFFSDDWKNMLFAQQLIAYHDESQCEVSKKLVKFKTFADKDSAVAFKEEIEASTGKRWSDVGHYGDKYYVGYCRAGELAIQAVYEAGRYYKLNVDLTAGYMLGNSWKTCH
jgi:hypothetical protein